MSNEKFSVTKSHRNQYLHETKHFIVAERVNSESELAAPEIHIVGMKSAGKLLIKCRSATVAKTYHFNVNSTFLSMTN